MPINELPPWPGFPAPIPTPWIAQRAEPGTSGVGEAEQLNATKTLGSRVKSFRLAVGLRTAADLAHATDGALSTSVIQNIESGRKDDISTTQLIALCKALRVTAATLVPALQEESYVLAVESGVRSRLVRELVAVLGEVEQ